MGAKLKKLLNWLEDTGVIDAGWFVVDRFIQIFDSEAYTDLPRSELNTVAFASTCVASIASGIKYLHKPNKNLGNTGNFFVKLFSFAVNFVLALEAIAQITLPAVAMLVLAPIVLILDTAVQFAKTIQNTILGLISDTIEEKRFYGQRIKSHVKGAFLTGLGGIASVFLVFGAAVVIPAIATSTAAIYAITIVTAAIVGSSAVITVGSFLISGIKFLVDKVRSNNKNKRDPVLTIQPKNVLQAKQNTVYQLPNVIDNLGWENYKHSIAYNKNTIIIARPIQHILANIDTYIATKRSQKVVANQSKYKVIALTLLKEFTLQIKKSNKTTQLEFNVALGKQEATIKLHDIDLTTKKGRLACYRQFKEAIKTRFPEVFMQFGLRTRDGEAAKLFNEVEAWMVQPRLSDIKERIASAQEEAGLKSAFKRIKTLSARTEGQAYSFLSAMVQAIEKGQEQEGSACQNELKQFLFIAQDIAKNAINKKAVLNNFINAYRNKTKSLDAYQAEFLDKPFDANISIRHYLANNSMQILGEIYKTDASFDVFGYGHFAGIYNDIREYCMRGFEREYDHPVNTMANISSLSLNTSAANSGIFAQTAIAVNQDMPPPLPAFNLKHR